MRKLFLLLPALLVAVKVLPQHLYTLQQALQEARTNNPAFKVQQFNLGLADADIQTSRLLPNLNLSNQYLFLTRKIDRKPGTGLLNPNNTQTMWQLYMPLQWFGQRKYKMEEATKARVETEKNLNETQRGIFYTVATQWLDAWTMYKQQELLQIARTNLDTLASINAYRYKKQVISETDLMRTRLLVDQFDLRMKTIGQQYRNSLKQLAFLVGDTDSIAIDTTDHFHYDVNLAGGDSLLNLALNGRTDLLAAQSALSVAETDIKLQKARAIPQPQLGVLYNPQNSIPYWGIYAAIDLPFFNRNQGEIRKSYITRAQNEQNVTAIQKQISTEVLNAYNSYQVQKANIQKYNTVLQQATTILDNIKYAYFHGGTTIVDLLEAQRSWLDTQQQYYDALQEYRRSYIDLLYATGLIGQLALPQ